MDPGTLAEDADVGALIAQLETLRDAALTVAALIGCGQRAIGPLRRCLVAGRPRGIFQPRAWVVEALAGLGAKDVLMEYLRTPKNIADPVVRLAEKAVESAAARALGGWRGEDVYGCLLEVAGERNLPGAIEALGNFARPDAIPIFDRALEDDACREAAEEAFRKLGAAARVSLALSAETPLPNAEMESPSSLRRRRSALRLLGELGIGPDDWPALAPLVEEDDPEIVTGGARLALAVHRGERNRIAHRLLAILPGAPWYLRDEVADCLAALAPESGPLVEAEIAARLRRPKRAGDTALPTLLHVRKRLGLARE